MLLFNFFIKILSLIYSTPIWHIYSNQERVWNEIGTMKMLALCLYKILFGFCFIRYRTPFKCHFSNSPSFVIASATPVFYCCTSAIKYNIHLKCFVGDIFFVSQQRATIQTTSDKNWSVIFATLSMSLEKLLDWFWCAWRIYKRDNKTFLFHIIVSFLFFAYIW